MDLSEGDYNPFEHRKIERATNNWETLALLLKGCVGSGVLAMPLAIKHAGLWLGVILTILIGLILLYGIYLVVRNSQRLCVRLRIPQMTFDQVGELALQNGPEKFQKFAKVMRYGINGLLMIDLFGCCSVYIMVTAKNYKQVIDYYTNYNCTVREYILMLLPFLLLYILIRRLKYLAPLSVIANFLVLFGMFVLLLYMFSDFTNMSSTKAINDNIHEFPLFFGIAIYAFGSIGIIMPLENNMETPEHFIQGYNILTIGMSFVITLYAFIGFFGYWKYGENTQGSIAINLPPDEIVCQLVKLCFATAMFQTFGLQFYAPFDIVWRNFTGKFGKWDLVVEYTFRYAIVILLGMIAFAVPCVGTFISLVGAMCLSFLGIVFPAVIDYVTCYETPGLGRYKWRLWVDLGMFILGIIGFFAGTSASIIDLYTQFCVVQ